MTAGRLPSDAAPCRHPTERNVEQVARLIQSLLPLDGECLARYGLTPEEYSRAFPAAVERLRGSWAASQAERRHFLSGLLTHLVTTGAIESFTRPTYGEDTVYTCRLATGMRIAIIQKGCPDGKHSSINWARPSGIDEAYLWWVCSSARYNPGQHVWKGVKRLLAKVSEVGSDQLDGVVFFSSECGTPTRPCPRLRQYGAEVEGRRLPPPCIYVFPRWHPARSEQNWSGGTARTFPTALLKGFGVPEIEVPWFTGYVGFKRSGSGSWRTAISMQSGTQLTTSRG